MDATEKQKALAGLQDVMLKLSLESVPAECQERWIARFSTIKGMAKRAEATADAVTELRGLLHQQGEALVTITNAVVSHFIEQGYKRMGAGGLGEAVGHTAAHILDQVMPAPMVERAITDFLSAGPAGIEAMQAAAERIRERFDGYLSQAGATDKARMPDGHWPRMLNALLGEILRRVAARVPPGGGGGRRVAA